MFFRITFFSIVAFLSVGASVSTQSGPSSTAEGVYVMPQARRGEVVFADRCAACHSDPFWREGWEGRRLDHLFTTISNFMPEDNPGSLAEEDVTDVMAFILSRSGFPAGSRPLPPDVDVLGTIAITTPTTPR
jgi:hypothetical protein